jgi:hypothetical protein
MSPPPMPKELQLFVATTKDIGSPESCAELLSALASAQPEFVPLRIGSHEPLRLRYAEVGVQGAQDVWMAKPLPTVAGGDLLFTLSPPLRGRGWVHWRRRLNHDVNFISVTLVDPKSNLEPAMALKRLGVMLFERFNGVYGYVADRVDFDRQHKITMPNGFRYAGARLVDAIPGIYWQTLFGSELVGLIGNERFKTLPDAITTWLPSGGVVLQSGGRPEDFTQPAVLLERETIRRSLGPELFFDISQPERETVAVPLDRSAIRMP